MSRIFSRVTFTLILAVVLSTLAGCGKTLLSTQGRKLPTIQTPSYRVFWSNYCYELAYHMPNAAETVEAPYTAAERLTFLPIAC